MQSKQPQPNAKIVRGVDAYRSPWRRPLGDPMLRRTDWLLFLVLAACGDHHATKTPDALIPPDASVDASTDAPPDGDATAPAVLTTTPIDGDRDVPQATAIRVRFTEPIDPATASAISITGVAATLTVTGDLVEL